MDNVISFVDNEVVNNTIEYKMRQTANRKKGNK